MKYYVVKNHLFENTAFSYGEHRSLSYKTGKAKVCQTCGVFLTSLEWLPPLEINVSKKKLGDFIYGTFIGFIVSEKFKDKFESADLEGLINFKKVDLYHKNKLLEKAYYYPEILHMNAFIDLNYVELEDKELCDTCQKGKSILNKIDGIIFKKPDLINLDVFFTNSIGESTIIVSQRFNNFVEEEKFTNIKFLEAATFRWDSLNPIG
ncbi:imm11 family protein [Myroides odoratus]|uniref:imm11 family protein n=1 Tax=Myroides odoratus TaxID=256 RepID=UPI0039AF1E1B